MKHLRLEVLTTVWGRLLRIVKQTHRGSSFGNDQEGNAFLHDGFRLTSLCRPAIQCGGLGFFARGSDTGDDYIILAVPSEEWLEKCRAAVRAYNQHFGDKAIPHTTSIVETIE
jgi:hypothetical protein